jgi:hypothetical protein
MRTSIRLAALASLILATSGCASAPPSGFVSVADSGSDLRAVAPDDSLFRLREFDVPAGSDFAFWLGALKHEFVARRGYVIAAERSVEVGGAQGVELTIETAAGGRAGRYLVTAWFEPGFLGDEMRVAEYLAASDVFDEHLDAVRTAIGSARAPQ